MSSYRPREYVIVFVDEPLASSLSAADAPHYTSAVVCYNTRRHQPPGRRLEIEYMSRKIVVPNVEDLVSLYQSGTSVNKISKQFGIGRNVINRILSDHGIQHRGRAEAERLKWSVMKLDRGTVERQCSAAWNSSRGRNVSEETKRKFAATIERTGCNRGPRSMSEQTLIDAVRALGYSVTRQKAVGPYNVDFSFDCCPVAVEVQRSELNRKGSRRSSVRPERIKGIFDAGFAVLVCYHPGGLRWSGERYDATWYADAIAKKTVAFAELVRSDPSLVGQYGMIGGDGKPVTSKAVQFDDFTRIEGF